jgi:hypothetical protein
MDATADAYAEDQGAGREVFGGGAVMLTPKDAEVGKRVKWVSPDVAGEVRYGVIVQVIDDVEVIIDFDDGAKGMAFVGNELSNVSPA